MALVPFQSQSWALAPTTETSPERRGPMPPEGSSEQQYMMMLALAETQAMRLAAQGNVRREPGYDSEDDFIDDSELEFELGIPCILVGSRKLVAYMGEAEEAGTCTVLLPTWSADPGVKRSVCPRSQLLALPLRPVRQGDWALPVRLEEKHSRFYGCLCLCGPALSGEMNGFRSITFPRGELSAFPPEMLILRDDQLVALPDASGQARPPWENHLQDVQVAPQLLPHEAILSMQEQAIHGRRLEDAEEVDESDGTSSESCGSVSSISDEEAPATLLAPGALVQVMDKAMQFAKIVSLDNDRAEIKMLHGTKISTNVSLTSLSILSRRRLVRLATCSCCQIGPSKDLLLCSNFGEQCVGAMHPECSETKGPFLCSTCQAREDQVPPSQNQRVGAAKRPLRELQRATKRASTEPAAKVPLEECPA